MSDTLNKYYFLIVYVFVITGCNDNYVIKDPRFTIELANIPKYSVRELGSAGNSGLQFMISDSIYLNITTFANGCIAEKSDFNFLLTEKTQECSKSDDEIFIGLNSEFNKNIYIEERVKIRKEYNNLDMDLTYSYEYWMKWCNKDRIIYIIGHERFNDFYVENVFNWIRKFDNIKIEIPQR